MANTYFKISKVVETKSTPKLSGGSFPGFTTEMSLSLTAFVGNAETGNIQLTVQTQSTLECQSGIGYITLTEKEQDLLIAGIMERRHKLVTATGSEKSVFSPLED